MEIKTEEINRKTILKQIKEKIQNKPFEKDIEPQNQHSLESFYIENGYIIKKHRHGDILVSKEFEILSTTRNLDDDSVSVQLSIDSIGKNIKTSIPFKDFTKAKFCDHLTKYGTDITENNSPLVIDYIMEEKNYVPQRFSHKQLGWSEYEGVTLFKHSDAHGFEYKSTYTGHYNLKETGNLKDWTSLVKSQVIGNSMLELALILGFSAPIVGLLSSEVLIVHIYGDSSKGKTTALRLAVSPFGKPETSSGGLIHTWNGTENAIISNLNGNFGMPVGFDEGSMKTGDFTKIIYSLASGTGRQRLNKEGELKETGSWKTTILSTAEHSLIDESSQNTGIKVRVLEIGNRYWTASAENAVKLNDGLKDNYGIVGQLFINYILMFKDTLKERLNKLKENISQDDRIQSSFTDRIAQKISLIILTAELVNECLGLNVNTSEIKEILIECESDKTENIDIGETAFEYIMQLVNKNLKNFVQGDYIPQNVTWGKIYKNKDNSREICIYTHSFHELMKKGEFESANTILANWREKGILECEAKRLSIKRTIIPKENQSHVYCIKVPSDLYEEILHPSETPTRPIRQRSNKVTSKIDSKTNSESTAIQDYVNSIFGDDDIDC